MDDFISTYEYDHVLSSFINSQVVPAVESFSIKNLHGNKDVTLTFANSYNVFIADNGSGKTTALFLFQALLSGQFLDLVRFKFDGIVIKFTSREELYLPYACFSGGKSTAILRRLMSRTRLGPNELRNLAHFAANNGYREFVESSVSRRILQSSTMRIPTRVAYDYLIELYERDSETDLSQEKSSDALKKFKEDVTEAFPYETIYLPTYRRVEQDLQTLFGDDEQIRSSKSIHFGMDDVERRMRRVQEKIRDHIVSSYSEISGQMLGQLASNIASDGVEAPVSANVEEIEVVLTRVGKSVSTIDRERILEMVRTDTLEKNGYLSFFLAKLVSAYSTVRELDTAMKEFATVCNKYLVNKELRYNSVDASIDVISNLDSNKIELQSLSSGEKQILGVMSHLYLSEGRTLAIVFDEPELSLSVEWQRRILPDIVRSRRCGFLIAATHSPFVFENELDGLPRSLKVFNRSVVGGVN